MANEAGIEYLGTAVDGVSLNKSDVKASVYGKAPIAQQADIVAVTGTVSLTTTINALMTVIRNFGLMA